MPDHRTAKYTYLGFVRFAVRPPLCKRIRPSHTGTASLVRVWEEGQGCGPRVCRDAKRLCVHATSQNNKERKLREQQTIQLEGASGTFLRLAIDSPHPHSKNLCSQVGIVDMCVEGELDLDASTRVLKAGQQGLDFTMLTHGIDLEDDFVNSEARMEGMGADAVRMVRRVVSLKQEAEAGEDYDEAARLCAIEAEVVEAGRKLEAAEAKKQAAVDREDYAAAKALKGETDGLKEQLRGLAGRVQSGVRLMMR